ncbi:hypothetical protein CVU37_09860 [candidate division BRC1 bacterium HGW-BRC1-1]|jgi:parvulin-like peptidyl-prolyl isomerase|nr:MAG: hypothetical protein CVU37_09860 [candidate division BRC1 bacterium HGW-BRC1-1]
MKSKNRNFNLALLGGGILICIITAMLLMQGRSRSSGPSVAADPAMAAADQRAIMSLQGGAADGRSPMGARVPAGAVTPAPTARPVTSRATASPSSSPMPPPELAARAVPVVAATPMTQASAPTQILAVEADVEPGTVASSVAPTTLQSSDPGAASTPAASGDAFDQALSAYQARSAAALTQTSEPEIVATPPLATPASVTGVVPGFAVPRGVLDPSTASNAPSAGAVSMTGPSRMSEPTPRPGPLPIQTNMGGNSSDMPATLPDAALPPGSLPRWGSPQNPVDHDPGAPQGPSVEGNPNRPILPPMMGTPGPTPDALAPAELPIEMPATVPPVTATPWSAVPPAPGTSPDVRVSQPQLGKPLPVSTPAAGGLMDAQMELPPLDGNAAVTPPGRNTPASAELAAAMSNYSAPTPPGATKPRVVVDDPEAATGAISGATAPSDPAATRTTALTIERSGAQVTISNARGGLRTLDEAPDGGTSSSVASPLPQLPPEIRAAIHAGEPPPPAPVVPAGPATTGIPAAPGAPVMANTAQPSPTPNFNPDGDQLATALGGAKPGDPAAALTPEQVAALPPEVAKRLSATAALAAAVAQQGAQVDDRSLTAEDINKRVQAALALRGRANADEATRVEMAGFIKQDWAEKTAIASEARRQGVTLTDAEIAAYRDKLKKRIGPKFEETFKNAGMTEAEMMAEMGDSALAEKFIEIAYQKNFDEKKLREVYQANPDHFAASRRLHVQEIYKAGDGAKDELSDVAKKAGKGEDFSQLASQLSEAPSKERGGDIGWIDAHSPITAEMAEALVNMKPGMVSEPIKTAKGWRIIKLVEIDEPAPGYEGARPNVENGVRLVLRKSAFDTAQLNGKVIIDGEVIKPGDDKSPSGGSGASVRRGDAGANQNGRASVRRADPGAVKVGQPVMARSSREGRSNPKSDDAFSAPQSTPAPPPPGFGPAISTR